MKSSGKRRCPWKARQQKAKEGERTKTLITEERLEHVDRYAPVQVSTASKTKGFRPRDSRAVRVTRSIKKETSKSWCGGVRVKMIKEVDATARCDSRQSAIGSGGSYLGLMTDINQVGVAPFQGFPDRGIREARTHRAQPSKAGLQEKRSSLWLNVVPCFRTDAAGDRRSGLCQSSTSEACAPGTSWS